MQPLKLLSRIWKLNFDHYFKIALDAVLYSSEGIASAKVRFMVSRGCASGPGHSCNAKI